jgi:hypothetical protein
VFHVIASLSLSTVVAAMFMPPAGRRAVRAPVATFVEAYVGAGEGGKPQMLLVSAAGGG